jgi:uncharacterized protein YndB with AHSA1/START domain
MDAVPPSEKGASGTSAASGKTEVTIALNVSATDIWQALTEPATVSRWFGMLTSPLRPGGSSRLDFGDGDFFELESIQLIPPHRLQYDWRFLGIGPLDHITWRIEPNSSGCLLAVIDSEVERSYETVQLLKEGWQDFIQRLERFLATGESTRYDWRREFDGSIELPAPSQVAWEVLLAPQMQAQWLPLAGSVLGEGTSITLADGIEPSELEIINVVRKAPISVSFQLCHTRWLNPTSCTLELSTRSNSALLTIQHLDWEGISSCSDDQLQQRRRFCACWIKVLRGARRLIDRYCIRKQ